MMRNIRSFVSLLLVLPPVCGQQSGLTLVDFIQHKEGKTWEKAQSFCREKHIDLVTIRNEEENRVFANFWGWIGLYRKVGSNTWKWSRGDEAPNYLNWGAGEPNGPLLEHCVVMHEPAAWRDTSCQSSNYFICYDETLVLVKENKTWEAALEHCRSLGGEDSENAVSVLRKRIYDLATLITADDHNYARKRAQKATTDEVWTGLRFLGDEWFWVGGEQVQYQDIPSCPAFRCGVLEKNRNTFFGIRDCSERRNFFCYKRPGNF